MGAIVLCANKLGAFCQLFYQVLFFCLSEQKPPTHFLTIRRRFEMASRQISTVQNTPICRKGHHVPGDMFSAGQKSTLSGAFQPAAAGHLHAGNSQTPNIVGHEDLRELVPVIHIIQLGTSDDRDVIVHKFLMEIAVSVGCAICRYQQVRPLIIRRTDRHQLELHRPLVQAAGCLPSAGGRCSGSCCQGRCASRGNGDEPKPAPPALPAGQQPHHRQEPPAPQR